MKTLLYATDYSQNSASALKLAHLLTKKFDAVLVIMHVLDMPISLASTVSVSHMKKTKKLLLEHQSKLKEFCTEQLGDTWKNTHINFEVGQNSSVVDGILEKATDIAADLIVVGSKGASPLKEFLLGSTAQGLIKKAPTMILSVPHPIRLENLRTMIYATDFEQADIFAINRLVKIATKFQSNIKIVHITTQKEYAGDQQMEWFKEILGQKVQYKDMEFNLMFSDNILEELYRYLEKEDADLVAMLERKDSSFIQKYLQRDKVKKMASRLTIPLISFNVGGL